MAQDLAELFKRTTTPDDWNRRYWWCQAYGVEVMLGDRCSGKTTLLLRLARQWQREHEDNFCIFMVPFQSRLYASLFEQMYEGLDLLRMEVHTPQTLMNARGAFGGQMKVGFFFDEHPGPRLDGIEPALFAIRGALHDAPAYLVETPPWWPPHPSDKYPRPDRVLQPVPMGPAVREAVQGVHWPPGPQERIGPLLP
jgi:hypothetical protein